MHAFLWFTQLSPHINLFYSFFLYKTGYCYDRKNLSHSVCMITFELGSDPLGPFRKGMATVLFPESGLYAVYDQTNHEDNKSYAHYHCHSDVNGHPSHRLGRCLVFCWGFCGGLYGCCLCGSHGCCRGDGGSVFSCIVYCSKSSPIWNKQ